MYARVWAHLRPPFSAQFRQKVPQWALTDCQNVSLCTVVRVSMCEYFENITYFHLQIYSMPQADQITRGGQNWQCRQKNLSFTFCSYFVNCFFPCFYFLFFFFLQKWKLHKCLRFSNKKKNQKYFQTLIYIAPPTGADVAAAVHCLLSAQLAMDTRL